MSARGRKLKVTAITALFVFGVACAEEFELDGDAGIEVQEGQVRVISRLYGTGGTLTKTGGGELVLNRIQCNKRPSVMISAGKVTVANPERPDLLDSAKLLLDADNEDAMAKIDVAGMPRVQRYTTGVVPVWGANKKNTATWNANLPVLLRKSDLANGHNLIDLGHYYNKLVDPGYGGAWLEASQEVGGIVEMYTVAMDREEVKTFIDDFHVLEHTEEQYLTTFTRAAPFFGAKQGASAVPLRGERAESGINSGILSASASAKTIDNAVSLDGVQVSAQEPYPDGVHALGFRFQSPLSVSYIASDRRQFSAGIRIGMVVGFDSALTDAQRRELTGYFMLSWIGSRQAFGTIEIAEGASLSVSARQGVDAMIVDRNSGSVVYEGREGYRARGVFAEAVSVKVKSGSVELPSVDTSSAFFHVDASCKDTIEILSSGGTNLVSKWKDVNGKDRYASRETSVKVVKELDYGHQPLPFIRPEANYKVNGLDVVDFGGYYHKGSPVDPLYPDQWSYGGSLRWSEECGNIREFFTVAADTEDLKYRTSFFNDGSATRASPFIGSNAADFLRCSRSTNEIPIEANSGLFLANGNWGKNGPTTTIDGESATAATAYPDGFHVLNSRIGSDKSVKGISFTREREVSVGGQRIGEFMVFESELSAERRAQINAYLMAKWLNRNGDAIPYFSFSTVEIDEEAALVRRGARIAVSGMLRLEGSVEAFSVEPVAMTFGVVPGTVKGRLRLGATGTVVLDWPKAHVKAMKGQEVKLCEATSVEGDVAGWTAATASGVPASLTVRDNALYCTVPEMGLMLLVR